MRRIQNILQIFFIASFVLASASPVCALISGNKSWMEICGPGGFVQTAEVPEDLLPFLPDDEQEQPQQVGLDCAFCFARANLEIFAGGQTQFILPPTEFHYVKLKEGEYHPSFDREGAHNPRGPPISFV